MRALPCGLLQARGWAGQVQRLPGRHRVRRGGAYFSARGLLGGSGRGEWERRGVCSQGPGRGLLLCGRRKPAEFGAEQRGQGGEGGGCEGQRQSSGGAIRRRHGAGDHPGHGHVIVAPHVPVPRRRVPGGRELQLRRGASRPSLRLVQRDSGRGGGVLFLERVELRQVSGWQFGGRDSCGGWSCYRPPCPMVLHRVEASGRVHDNRHRPSGVGDVPVSRQEHDGGQAVGQCICGHRHGPGLADGSPPVLQDRDFILPGGLNVHHDLPDRVAGRDL
mmetsp:Transcript_32717/g.77460  ORF Transcript_32717/g.77460 Transcript_32717/m.77460 type:complete len:275 (-) Transcript_32717:65-889(-)